MRRAAFYCSTKVIKVVRPLKNSSVTHCTPCCRPPPLRCNNAFLSSPRCFQTSTTVSSTLEDLEKAKQKIGTLTKDPGNDLKLKLYSLYKQVLKSRTINVSIVCILHLKI